MKYEEFLNMQAHKVRKAPVSHPEENIQRDCVRWFRDAYPEIASLLFHPNNEPYFGGFGKTEEQRLRAGARAKSIGVTPGVADLVLLVPEYWPMPLNPHCNALCIEMKSSVGRQSDTQKEWQKHCESVGNKYVVVRSLDEFKRVIASYITKKPRDPREVAIARLFGKKV